MALIIMKMSSISVICGAVALSVMAISVVMKRNGS